MLICSIFNEEFWTQALFCLDSFEILKPNILFIKNVFKAKEEEPRGTCHGYANATLLPSLFQITAN